VLQDRATSVLALRQTVRPRDGRSFLSRQLGRRQVVDLLTGDLIR
jgi:hypothetical protein